MLILIFYYYYFFLQISIFFFKLRILKSQLINFSFFGSYIASGLDSLFLFLFVSRAACFVVFTPPFLYGPVCREGARSGVCHIRCVRIPIGYRPPSGAIPANQLSASWPFRWRPDPDGRWSVWLVAVSTGTAGWGGGRRGGGGPGRRARDFLGQSLLFPSCFLLSTPLRLESWQPLLAGLHHVSHARTLSSLLLQSQK